MREIFQSLFNFSKPASPVEPAEDWQSSHLNDIDECNRDVNTFWIHICSLHLCLYEISLVKIMTMVIFRYLESVLFFWFVFVWVHILKSIETNWWSHVTKTTIVMFRYLRMNLMLFYYSSSDSFKHNSVGAKDKSLTPYEFRNS